MKTKNIMMKKYTTAKVLFGASDFLDKVTILHKDYLMFKIGYSVGYSTADSKISIPEVLDLVAELDLFYPAKNRRAALTSKNKN